MPVAGLSAVEGSRKLRNVTSASECRTYRYENKNDNQCPCESKKRD